MELFEVIHEDEAILVVNKPAGLVCHPTKGDVYSSLISRIRLYLGINSDLHLINRLDRETSGIILAAKSLSAARALRQLWERREVRKSYRAIVHGIPVEQYALINLPLGKDEQSIVAIKDKVRADGSPAQTHYWLERAFKRPEGEFSLLQVLPVTGRKHQIRIHLAFLGHPIVGDKLYGGDEMLYLSFVKSELAESQKQRLILENQALHAYELQYQLNGQSFCFHAKAPVEFEAFAISGHTVVRSLDCC
jgi:23S rRNA pseudouridine1911/1915/1917 synthase